MMTGKFAGLGVYGGNVPRDQRPPTWNRVRQLLSGFEIGEDRGVRGWICSPVETLASR
jgi:hypothetical protein